MELTNWFGFVLATVALLLIPGPTILTVISFAVSRKVRDTLSLVLAVTVGDLIAVGLSLAGLGAVLSASAFWFGIVKTVGAGYLIFLGLQMLFSQRQPSRDAGPANHDRAFVTTLTVTALNPKSIVFFVAFLPQFVDTNRPVLIQLFILSATFILLAALVTGAYAVAASLTAAKAENWVSPNKIQRVLDRVGGTLLVGAGFWALRMTRQSEL